MKTHYRQAAISVGLLLLSFALTACGHNGADLTAELFQLDEVLGGDVPVARAMPDDRPAAAPVLLTPVPQTDQNCLDCHTDVQTLQELATEAEPSEAPSSGEG